MVQRNCSRACDSILVLIPINVHGMVHALVFRAEIFSCHNYNTFAQYTSVDLGHPSLMLLFPKVQCTSADLGQRVIIKHIYVLPLFQSPSNVE